MVIPYISTSEKISITYHSYELDRHEQVPSDHLKIDFSCVKIFIKSYRTMILLLKFIFGAIDNNLSKSIEFRYLFAINMWKIKV